MQGLHWRETHKESQIVHESGNTRKKNLKKCMIYMIHMYLLAFQCIRVLIELYCNCMIAIPQNLQNSLPIVLVVRMDFTLPINQLSPIIYGWWNCFRCTSTFYNVLIFDIIDIVIILDYQYITSYYIRIMNM